MGNEKRCLFAALRRLLGGGAGFLCDHIHDDTALVGAGLRIHPMLHAHRTVRVTSDCRALERMMRAAISRVGPRVAHSYNHAANYTAGRLWGQGKTPPCGDYGIQVSRAVRTPVVERATAAGRSRTLIWTTASRISSSPSLPACRADTIPWVPRSFVARTTSPSSYSMVFAPVLVLLENMTCITFEQGSSGGKTFYAPW